MNVRFRTNLGSIDAKAISLKHGDDINHADCVVGAVVNVTEGAGQELVDRGIAEATKATEPAKVKGEAKKPDITGPAK